MPGIPQHCLSSTVLDHERNAIGLDDGDKNVAGLAISGGGIRSATFALGLLESLKDSGLLSKFHYLSTVSGGGYIGAWLSANRRRRPTWFDDDWTESIAYLRRYSNYLSPRVGFFSADTWSMLTIWLRNTILIQTTVILAIACALLVPRPLFWLFHWWPGAGALRWATVLLFIFGIVGIAGNHWQLTAGPPLQYGTPPREWRPVNLLKGKWWSIGLAGSIVLAALALAEVTVDGTLAAALMEIFLRASASPLLDSLPPLFAIESSLQLLRLFGIASDASLWTHRRGRLECVVSVGEDEPTRRMRLAARVALASGPGLGSTRRSLIRAVPVFRWGRAEGVLVVRAVPETRSSASAFLAESATSLSPLLERAHLLDRSADRERSLVSGSERRLMRLGFDLHDGPIQDVLAAAADLRRLRDDIYPFIAHEHRESAYRRFEDLTSRLDELDGELREISHSLESRSAANRPIEEVLHREVETFRQRTTIDASLVVEGNYSFLTSSQRVALFRAVQESLSNVREHSGATRVEIVLRSRRSWTELRIVDDGKGFGVEHGLASAAKRGRLGLIGIAERVRMLGGSFEIESAPGGPTTLAVTLPRWEPLDPSSTR